MAAARIVEERPQRTTEARATSSFRSVVAFAHPHSPFRLEGVIAGPFRPYVNGTTGAPRMTDIRATTDFPLGDRSVKRMGYGAMQLAGPGVFGPPKDLPAALAVLR